jgi:hypothetical protein
VHDFPMLLEQQIPRLRRYAFALHRSNRSRADDLVQGVKQPFNRGWLSTPVMVSVPGSGSFPRSEPHDDVRGGRLNVRNEVRAIAFSRLTEVTITTVPAGTPTGAAQSAGRMLIAFTPSLTPTQTRCRRSRCSAG